MRKLIECALMLPPVVVLLDGHDSAGRLFFMGCNLNAMLDHHE
jgi:hypothetical protein